MCPFNDAHEVFGSLRRSDSDWRQTPRSETVSSVVIGDEQRLVCVRAFLWFFPICPLCFGVRENACPIMYFTAPVAGLGTFPTSWFGTQTQFCSIDGLGTFPITLHLTSKLSSPLQSDCLCNWVWRVLENEGSDWMTFHCCFEFAGEIAQQTFQCSRCWLSSFEGKITNSKWCGRSIIGTPLNFWTNPELRKNKNLAPRNAEHFSCVSAVSASCWHLVGKSLAPASRWHLVGKSLAPASRWRCTKVFVLFAYRFWSQSELKMWIDASVELIAHIVVVIGFQYKFNVLFLIFNFVKLRLVEIRVHVFIVKLLCLFISICLSWRYAQTTFFILRHGVYH